MSSPCCNVSFYILRRRNRSSCTSISSKRKIIKQQQVQVQRQQHRQYATKTENQSTFWGLQQQQQQQQRWLSLSPVSGSSVSLSLSLFGRTRYSLESKQAFSTTTPSSLLSSSSPVLQNHKDDSKRTVQVTQTTTTSTVDSSESTTKFSQSVYSQESVDATKLVDDLLQYTRFLMNGGSDASSSSSSSTTTTTNSGNFDDNYHRKNGNIQTHYHHHHQSPHHYNPHQTQQHQQQLLQRRHVHHIIAYSGGIDSSVVAALVYRAAKDNSTTDNIHHKNNNNNSMNTTTTTETVRAVLGLSPAVPADQVQLAERVAQHIGIPLEQIPTTEGTDQVYIENSGQACLACKTHLYTCLESIVQHSDRTTTTSTSTAGTTTNYSGNDNNNPTSSSLSSTTSTKRFLLYNGTNADDLQDPTRLGLIAAKQFSVLSPLQYTTKDQVRMVGKHLGLPNWNYAASPCLRSRLAIGVEAIPQHLKRIELAEQHIKTSLQLDATHNVRVRLLSNNRAMIEVDEELLPIILNTTMSTTTSTTGQLSWLDQWQSYFCNELNFASVQVRPFKSGSVAPKHVSVATTAAATTAANRKESSSSVSKKTMIITKG